jgi:hypothetical protein
MRRAHPRGPLASLKDIAAGKPKKACCAACARGQPCSNCDPKGRLRRLLASLVEEAPDECPSKADAIAALDAKRARVDWLCTVLAELSREAPDACPSKTPALFAAAHPAIDLEACAKAAREAVGRFEQDWDDLTAHEREPWYDTAIAVLEAAGIARRR